MQSNDPMDGQLWTPRELAQFFRYTESTIRTLICTKPETLPPRVAHLYRPRWDPAVVRAWTVEQSKRQVNVRRSTRQTPPLA